jgi:4-hydroxythreonine-4-phosphate dehydrogenase
MKRYAITTGDEGGVGFEVSAKALSRLGPQSKAQFVLFRGRHSEVKYFKLLQRKFEIVTITSYQELTRVPPKKNLLVDFAQSSPPPFWVKEAAELCIQKKLAGIITGPLSKELIQKSGFSYAKGHTEILQKVSGGSSVNMVFIGKFFNVLLATGHIPFKQVPSALEAGQLKGAIEQAFRLRKILPQKLRKKPVAIIGLNPHAGEGGLLGEEELRFFDPILSEFPKKDWAGPLPPDVAFKKKNWNQYAVFVCAYHDQGLIPFKLVHGADSGYHLTFGLPFVRTSVDHGTAFDIFSKNRANPNSMLDAIKACLALTK